MIQFCCLMNVTGLHCYGETLFRPSFFTTVEYFKMTWDPIENKKKQKKRVESENFVSSPKKNLTVNLFAEASMLQISQTWALKVFPEHPSPPSGTVDLGNSYSVCNERS